jgi:hypothetical protein
LQQKMLHSDLAQSFGRTTEHECKRLLPWARTDSDRNNLT